MTTRGIGWLVPGAVALAAVACDGPTSPYGHECTDVRVGGSSGAIRILPSAEALCLDLPDGPGRWVVAGLDSRAVTRARAGEAEEADASGEPFSAWVADPRRVSSESALSATGAHAGFAASADALPAVPAEDCPDHPMAGLYCREGPWAPGDSVTLPAPFNGVWIVRMVESGFVLMEPAPLGFLPVDPTLYRAALRAVSDHLLPVVRGSLGHAVPGTGVMGEQLVVLLTEADGLRGSGGARWIDGTARGLVTVDALEDWTVAGLAGLLAHETAHAWQGAYAFSVTETDVLARIGEPLMEWWAVEGGATFLEQEFLRRWAGLPWDADLAVDGRADRSTAAGTLAASLRMETGVTGRIAFRAGYGSTAAFFRWIVTDLADAGLPYESAIRTVMRGALEGWFGHALPDVAGGGLAPRVRTVLGGSWDPVEGLLEWTASAALDDRVVPPVRGFPWVRDAPSALWPPAGSMVLGRDASVTAFNELGSTFWVDVDDPVGGGRLLLDSDLGESMRWAVARVH